MWKCCVDVTTTLFLETVLFKVSRTWEEPRGSLNLAKLLQTSTHFALLFRVPYQRRSRVHGRLCVPVRGMIRLLRGGSHVGCNPLRLARPI